ncbi:MAG TPA: sigma-70 family RNA polymerase sigma factor [Polyangiaceae bacterium]|nr:sigma-70 family RNA polymerase sigma factor [Polyangiaceae bacterium]
MEPDRPRATRSRYPAPAEAEVAGGAGIYGSALLDKEPAAAASAPSALAHEMDRAAALVEAARQGDTAAIEALITLLAPRLLRAIRALMGPAHPDVEDLVQEVLVDLMDALPSFRGESTLLHFAIRIATRKMTKKRRRAHAIRAWLEQWKRSEEPLSSSPASPREELVAERRRGLLRELLSELPEAQAEALVMRLSLGYSIEDIAEITRAPINTVRSRLRLGKEALRARVANDPRWAELGVLES